MPQRDKRQYQADVDHADRFLCDKYISKGYGAHFHRTVEIYAVVKGKVNVRIAGEQRTLTDGQMAIVGCMELHSYEIDGEAEVCYLQIGARYLSTFYALYKRSALPRFLTDAEKNREIYATMQTLLQTQDLPELKKHGVTDCLLAEIIARYGVREEARLDDSYDLVEKVVGYVYEHYREKITLQGLAKTFCIEAKTLSKKLSKSLGVDLRVFVNDVRAQKALAMRDDPAYRELPLKEIGRLCGFTAENTFYRAYKRNDLR